MSAWNRFWFEQDVLSLRLRTLRAALFGLLAFDLWVLMVPHAPRYGVDGFNVTQLAALDGLLPTPVPALATALYLVAGVLSVRVALGVATRGSVIALTVIYSAVYLWSQIDSYQHHYLMCWVLLLCCFMPLTSTDERVKSSAARMLYAQVAIVYLYTAITKMDAGWVDGSALQRIINTESMQAFLATMAGWFGQEPKWAYALTGWSILLWQLLASAAFVVPKLRVLACLTGPVFHILVEVIDLKIGWFSYYMIALYYVLLFPDRWFLFLARPIGWALRPFNRLRERIATWSADEGTEIPIALVSGAVTAALVAWLPLEGATAAGLVVGAVVAFSVGSAEGVAWRAGAQTVAVAAMVVAFTWSSAAYDYHRFWAGDLRRRGHLSAAADHYRKANAIQPGGRAKQLADVEAELKRRR